MAHQITNEDRDEYEWLEIECIFGIRYAEKRCRKIRTGGIPWLSEFSSSKYCIEVWTLVCSMRQWYYVTARKSLRKKLIRHGSGQYQCYLLYLIWTFKCNIRIINVYLNESRVNRQKYQQEFAEARVKERNTGIAIEINNIVWIEK